MVCRDGSLEEITYSKIRRKTRSGQENGEGGEKTIAGREKSAHKDLEKKAHGTLERRPVGLDHVLFIPAASPKVCAMELSRFCPCKLLINDSASPTPTTQSAPYPSPLPTQPFWY